MPLNFRPRILDIVHGYSRQRLVADMGAGATVGVVALPLAMAFAIASGLPPQAGLWTAIIGGLLVALLGGSNVQIAGPAGAFIVIVYGIVQQHGVAGLWISTSLAGVLLMLMGFLRLGALVRFVPVSIIIGFTNGIAVLIALSQLKDALGLPIAKMPGDFFGQMQAIAGHLAQWNPYALALALACMLLLWIWPRLMHHQSPLLRLDGITVRTFARLPAPVIALVLLTAVAHVTGMPVTGTIARTVTNLRSGATSPISGMVHALFLALIVLLAAPLALHVPLAVLAGILLFVAWNMGEWHEFVRLRQFSNHYRLLLLGTFVLTVVLDLMVAVEVGLALSCLLFVRRMATLFRATPLAQDGPAQLAWTLHGVLFFGATARLDELEDAINQAPQGVQVLLDLSDLLSLDTTGVDALEQLLKAAEQRGGRLRIRGAQPQVQSLLERSGLAAKLGEATPT